MASKRVGKKSSREGTAGEKKDEEHAVKSGKNVITKQTSNSV